MYSKNSNQTPKGYQLHTQSSGYQANKNYLNYVNFQSHPTYKTSLRQIPQEPEQTASYSINTRQPPPSQAPAHHPNRSPYLNNQTENHRQPQNRQPASRLSAQKQQLNWKESQDYKSGSQFLKNSSKTSLGFNGKTSEMQKLAKPSLYLSEHEASPQHSKTLDLNNFKQRKLLQQSRFPEDELKQKLNYLQVLEQSLREFQSNRSPDHIRQLSQDNRMLMLAAFEEVSRLKEERSRRATSDCVSESDNFSEDACSLDGRSDSRSSSKPNSRKYAENLSRSRQKSKAKSKQIQQQRKLNEKLKQEYDEELRKLNQNGQSELEKLAVSIQKQEEQINKIMTANQEISALLIQLPFHHQWKIMCNEAEGAKRARLRIEEELNMRKKKLNQCLSGSTKTPLRSEQTSVNQKEEQRGRQGSQSKGPYTTNLKIPPSPVSRGLINSQHQTGSRNSQQVSTKNEIRSKSSNRFNISS